MPILGIYASQISGHLFNPTGSFEAIQTYTVDSGGAASITFSSIPQTYTHLQIRGILRSATANTGDQYIYGQFNSDTTSSYSWHDIYAVGAGTPTANATSTTTQFACGLAPQNSITSGIFGATIIDILDYTNTNKYKTVRFLTGDDRNGSGSVDIGSGLWQKTTAINAVTLYCTSVNLTQYSQFALYGVK